jgi:hypothetical protein
MLRPAPALGLAVLLVAAPGARAQKNGGPAPEARLQKGEAKPPAGTEGGSQLSEQDRHNVAAGLLRRALKLEGEGKFAEAQAIWERLAEYSETRMAARQHRIWYLLQRPPHESAPSPADLERARRLIRGAGGADDPLLFEEQLALASALTYSATDPDPAKRRQVWEQARDEFRLVLQGLPGAPGRQAPEHVRRIAEWNLAVLTIWIAESGGRARGPSREGEILIALVGPEPPAAPQPPALQKGEVERSPAAGAPEGSSPAYWERALAEFPALPGRERIRLYMAMRLAEANLIANRPAEVERALALAGRIAAGQEGTGSLSVPNGAEELRLFRRYLAKLAFQRNVADQYRSGFLQQTDYGGEYRAWEAAELFHRFVADLRDRPASIGDAPSTWTRILALLRDARTMATGNTALQTRLDDDIRAVQDYLKALEENPPAITYRWNQAAERTNTAKTPADWEAAAAAWREVLGLLQGRPAADRAEAARHVVNAYMREAALLFRANDRPGARASPEQARDALGAGPTGVGAFLTPEDRAAITRRLENNLRALGQ